MTIAFGWPQPNPTQPLQRAIGTIHLLPGSLVHSTPAAATVRALPHDFPSEDNFVMGDRKKSQEAKHCLCNAGFAPGGRPEQNSSVPGPLLLMGAVVGQWEWGEQRVG